MWYRKAAEQGLAEPQYKLGNELTYGQGSEQNFAKATSWYRQGSRAGQFKGTVQTTKYKLGYVLVNDQGVAEYTPRTGKRRRRVRKRCIGNGGGRVAKACHRHRPRARGGGGPPASHRRGRRRQAFARPLVGPPQYSPCFECPRLDSYVSIKTSSTRKENSP